MRWHLFSKSRQNIVNSKINKHSKLLEVDKLCHGMSEKEDRDMSRCSDLIKKTISSSRLRRP